MSSGPAIRPSYQVAVGDLAACKGPVEARRPRLRVVHSKVDQVICEHVVYRCTDGQMYIYIYIYIYIIYYTYTSVCRSLAFKSPSLSPGPACAKRRQRRTRSSSRRKAGAIRTDASIRGGGQSPIINHTMCRVWRKCS